MSWGIVYPPYSVINMGAVQPPTPTTRWVYNYNGVDSYIDLGSINYTAGDTISLKASKPSNGATFPTVVGNTVNSFLLIHTSSGKIELRGATGTVNGVDIVSTVTDWPSGDSEFNLTLTVGGLVRYLCSRSDAVTGLFQGRVYDYQDSLGNNYPINDRTFGTGAPIANSATVLGSNLWGGQNLTVANVGVVTTVVSGEEWDVYSLNGSPSNVVHGARVNVFSGLADGEQYLYDIDSSEPVNIAVYDAGYQLVSGGVVENGKGILFTHNGTSRMYVCPRTTNTIRVSNGRVRLANGYATGVNLLESGWEEITL